ncbi:MAG: MFS transporter [Rhizobiaceae bacterium]|nr:MFS transporter [Rhizobiaceae bacterium]
MNVAALSFRDFRLYLGGNIFALNALWMQRVTIGWIAWDLTASSSFVGFIAFMNFAPTLVSGPLFGVWIDRVRVKRAALVTQSLMLAIAAAIYLLFSFGLLNTLALSVLSGLSGIVASAHHPVRMSLAPRLVDREAVGSVINIAAINFSLARLTGPALGGWVIAVWGVSTALLVQALCYLPFILAIGFLCTRQRSASITDGRSFLGALADGFRHVLTHALIRHAILITALFAVVVRGTLEILPVLADGVFEKGAVGLGLLTSSAGLGALAAGVAKIVMPIQIAGRLPKTALVSALVGIGLVPLVGLSISWVLSVGLIACLGFAGTLSAVSFQTAIQTDLDDDLRGRVMSLWVMVGIGGAAIGAIALGFLVDQLGFSGALICAGGVAGAGLAILLMRISRTTT